VRNLLARRWLLTLVRLTALLSMAFGTSFGFLAAISSPGANYDPYSFAIGASALFGAACGALGLVISQLNVTRKELRALRTELAPECALRHQREQADAGNRAKSRFLATVSHEILTPLHGLLGMSDLLLDTALSAEQATYANAVKQSGQILLRVVEDVLDFSTMEDGRFVISARPFDLPQLVDETIELIAPRAQAKQLEIACYINEKIPQMLVGDPARLRQVLLNVAGNAVKFTEQGGIALTIELEAERDAVRFSVRDTGIGIAGEAQERIFLEFEQGDTTRQLDGAGLGLAICNRGNIGVESAPGRGSLFHFCLPLPAASDQPRLFNRANLTGADILIVAPVFITASLLSRRLMDWGARTCMVPDLAPAKLHLSQRYWRAVMVDFGLGLETCEFVARETPSSMRRIAAITPSQRNVLPVLKQAGFDYLVKPIRAASLAAPHGYRPGEPGTRRRVHGRST
jgi:signal transduction histidine kinase